MNLFAQTKALVPDSPFGGPLTRSPVAPAGKHSGDSYGSRQAGVVAAAMVLAMVSPMPLHASSVTAQRCRVEGPVTVVVVDGAPELRWTTAGEFGVVGFDLLGTARSAPLNGSLVLASNTPAGARYAVSCPWDAGASEVVVRVWTTDGSFTDHTFEVQPERPPVPRSVAVPALASVPVPQKAAASRPANRPTKSGVPVVVSVDIRTTRAGVCFIGYDELAEAFQLPVEEIVRRAGKGGLALRQQGVLVPSWGDATTGGRYFFTPRIESLYFAGNVTQASFEETPPMTSLRQPAALASGRTDARGRTTVEQNFQGVPTLPGAADDDFWVWDVFLGNHPSFGTRRYPFDLAGLVQGNGITVVEVEIISTSVAQHGFGVSLNGHALGSETWSGPERRRLRLDAEASWLQAAGNILEISSTGDRTSLAYLDRFRVEHPRALRPTDTPVLFSATDDAVLEASGPPGSTVEVWDVAAPARPIRLEGADPAADPATLRFTGSPGHDYVTFLRGAADRPDALRAFGPDELRTNGAGAEYLLIAPDPLVDAAGILAGRRSAQGLSAWVVPLARIQHEFGFGIPTPEALARFLDFTVSAHPGSVWTSSPRYAVLIGDGTYDYRGYLGQTDNLVPPLMTMTHFGRAVSDVLFGDPDRDGRPEIAIGRLPVHTEEELLRVIGQMDDYSSRTVDRPKALLLADRPDEGGGFIANAEELGSRLDGPFSVEKILNDASDLPIVRDRLMQGLAGGVSLFNYIGHGGRDRLGSGYLTADEVGTVDFGPQQPLVVAMTCAAGQFGLPGTTCLGEALLSRTGRGPVAVWSPSGFSIDFQAHQLNLLLADELSRQPVGTRLGDTLKRTITAYHDIGGDPVSPTLYNLLGDPALPLNFGARPLRLSARVEGDGLRLGLSGTPGKTYRVEVSDRIDPPAWRPLRGMTTDASGNADSTQTLPAGPEPRFFRVVPAP